VWAQDSKGISYLRCQAFHTVLKGEFISGAREQEDIRLTTSVVGKEFVAGGGAAIEGEGG